MEQATRRARLAKTAGTVSFATLISRVLGLVREMVLAKYFPVFSTDAFFAAFRIPNLLRDLFAEGVLSAAFIPTLTDYSENRGKKEAWLLANNVLNVLTIALSILTLVMLFGAKYLVYFLVSGYAEIPGKLELTIHLTQILSPFLLTIALAAAVMGILNTQNRFFIPALSPAWFNLLSILSGIFLAPFMPRFGQQPITAMAIGSLLGGAAQLFFQIPTLYGAGYRYQSVLDWKHPGLRRIMGLMLPAAFGLAATQINILIDNQLASYLGNGPVSWLNYAFRLMQLPIGLFGVAIATVSFATVSKKVAAGDTEGVRSNLAEAIKLAAFLNIPSMFGLIFLRYPIVQVLYERGRFVHEYTINTGDALLFYSLGLYAYSLVKIVTPIFYALGDTKTPVKFAALVIAIKIAVNLAAIRYLGFIGLALGTAIASILNTTFLLIALRSKIGSLSGHGLASYLLRITFISLIMGWVAQKFHPWISRYTGLAGLIPRSEALLITIIASLLLFLALSFVFRIEHVRGINRRDTR